MAISTLTPAELSPKRDTIKLIYRVDNEDQILNLPMPEDISFGVASSWESFSEGSLVDFINAGAALLPSGVIGSAGRLTAKGNELYTRAKNDNTFISSFSHQTWRGTSPIEFNLKIILTAFTSAKDEVMTVLEKLLHLSLPAGRRNSNGGLAETAAQSALEKASITDAQFIKSPPRDISLYLGMNLAFPAIIIPSVNISFPTRMDKNGDFIFAEADITIRTSYTPTANLFKFKSFESEAERQEQQKSFSTN